VRVVFCAGMYIVELEFDRVSIYPLEFLQLFMQDQNESAPVRQED